MWESQIEDYEKDQYEEIMEKDNKNFNYIFDNEEHPKT